MKQIMEDNGIDDPMHFPKIKPDDAQVLILGGKPGQLVKIIRRDVTGSYPYYRVIY
jgi:DNA-directed RNA polymerase subunit H (RpoH/RPB5)